MRKSINCCYVLIIFVLIQGCKRQDKPFGESLLLTPPVINDELITDMINSIAVCGEYFVAVNSGKCQFFAFDKQAKLIHTYGTKGKGPSEYLWPAGIHVENDITYAYDYLKKSVLLNSPEGEVVREIFITEPIAGGRFCVQNQQIYFHSMNNLPVIAVEHATGVKSKEFGEFYPPIDSEADKYFNNMMLHILPYDGQIVTVNAQHAVIHIYEQDGSLKRKTDFPQLESFFKEIVQISMSRIQPNTNRFAIINISDCCIDGDRLFLLLTRPVGEPETVQINTILVIDLHKDEIIYTIRLPGEYYNNLAISGGKLMTYNYSQARFELFSLPLKIYR